MALGGWSITRADPADVGLATTVLLLAGVSISHLSRRVDALVELLEGPRHCRDASTFMSASITMMTNTDPAAHRTALSVLPPSITPARPANPPVTAATGAGLTFNQTDATATAAVAYT